MASLPLLYGSLTVTVCKAANLKNADGNLTSFLTRKAKNYSDPYVRVALDSVKICRTKTIQDDLNPVFNESMEPTLLFSYSVLNIVLQLLNVV